MVFTEINFNFSLNKSVFYIAVLIVLVNIGALTANAVLVCAIDANFVLLELLQ